jgi:hypothetical protein
MKKLFLIIIAAFTFNANAATIDQTTSSRLDTAFVDLGVTHLDLSTGLEWLNFGTLIDGERTSVTFGHSIDSALAAYAPQGFRLATEDEVIGLFDLFFPSFVDSGNGTMLIDDTDPTQLTLSEERNSWLFSFGTYIDDPTGNLQSLGFYLDSFGQVQEAGIDLLTNPLSSTIYGLDYREWVTGTDEAFANRGVFMVRDYAVVPVPAAVWLFGTGLLLLIGIARRI